MPGIVRGLTSTIVDEVDHNPVDGGLPVCHLGGPDAIQPSARFALIPIEPAPHGLPRLTLGIGRPTMILPPMSIASLPCMSVFTKPRGSGGSRV